MKQFCEMCKEKTYHVDGCMTCAKISRVLSRHPRPRDLARDLIEAAQLIQDLNSYPITKTTRDKAMKKLELLSDDYGIDPIPF